MNNKIAVLVSLLGIFLIGGCAPQYPLKVQSIDVQEIEYTDMRKELICIEQSSSDLRDGGLTELVINSNEEYQKLLSYKSIKEHCRNELPYINFSKYTLLGKYVVWGCPYSLAKTVHKDDSNKKIVYAIKLTRVERSLPCLESAIVSMNFITIPKFSSDYAVNFMLIK